MIGFSKYYQKICENFLLEINETDHKWSAFLIIQLFFLKQKPTTRARFY